MARPYRLQGEHCFYHVMSRGDDRKKIYGQPGDYGKFMDYALKAKKRYSYHLYAYCLMPNHFHLLVETMLPNISQIMHYIKGSYTTYHNIRYRRCGHLFQGRFKSIVVDKSSYFLALSRYVHLNPVHAGLVQDPAAYVWSSYRGYTGKKDDYIDLDLVKCYLGMSRSAYQRYVMAGLKRADDPFQNVYAGFLLGSAEFIKDRLQDLEVQITSNDVAHKKALQDDATKSAAIIVAVTAYYRTALTEIKRSTARPMRAKQLLIYCLRTYTGLSNHQIGELVGIRPSAVSKAGMVIERLLETDRRIKRTIVTIVSKFEG